MNHANGFPLLPITKVILVVTDACNFACSYCTVHKRDATLSVKDAQAFLELCYPRMAEEVWIQFYGGEPLLAFDVVRSAVSTIRTLQHDHPKKVNFGLTTNGWLLDDAMIDFMAREGILFGISFDGYAQDESRKNGSFAPLAEMLASLPRRHPRARYIVYSVFTPSTVEMMADSLLYIDSLRPGDMGFGLDAYRPWSPAQIRSFERQMRRLFDFNLECLRTRNHIPINNFRGERQKKLIACFAGRDRMSIHPGGHIWGCSQFGDYLQPWAEDHDRYYFGRIEEFRANGDESYRRHLPAYLELRQDRLINDEGELCALCPDLLTCHTCPPALAKVTGVIGVIPSYFCRLARTEQKIYREFNDRVRQIRGERTAPGSTEKIIDSPA